jgi:hypothetical protein
LIGCFTYQQVVAAHQLTLPYSHQVQESDLVVLVPEGGDVPLYLPEDKNNE